MESYFLTETFRSKKMRYLIIVGAGVILLIIVIVAVSSTLVSFLFKKQVTRAFSTSFA